MKPLTWYRELADSRKRRENGCFLAEGRRTVGLIRALASASVEELLIIGDAAEKDAAGPPACPVRLLTEKQFSSICTAKTPQGIAAVVRIPDGSYGNRLPEDAGNRLLLLEGVQDPGNVGTLVRTAAALRFQGIMLSSESADPFSPKAVQASAGSIMAIWLRRTERYLDCAQELKERGYRLLAADLTGEDPALIARVKSPLVVMLGSEGSGISDQIRGIADTTIAIPMDRRNAESLNVAVSGGILMYLAGSRK